MVSLELDLDLDTSPRVGVVLSESMIYSSLLFFTFNISYNVHLKTGNVQLFAFHHSSSSLSVHVPQFAT